MLMRYISSILHNFQRRQTLYNPNNTIFQREQHTTHTAMFTFSSEKEIISGPTRTQLFWREQLLHAHFGLFLFRAPEGICRKKFPISCARDSISFPRDAMSCARVRKFFCMSLRGLRIFVKISAVDSL